MFFSWNPVIADDIYEDQFFIETFSSPEYVNQVPVINAQAAVVMDMDSGRVLFEKNAYSRRAMASTTKIMTAILAVENGNLNDEVTISKRAASIRGSTIGLQEGDKLTLKELLYGLMLSSGNDAAIAIAEHIGSSVEEFAKMMTKKAYQIGARNTCFINPHGLDTDGHYTTAYDMALIARYALNNPIINEIVKTQKIQSSFGTLYNTNELLGVYPGADGVKTGYTGKAGRCLVASATRNGHRLISVVLGSPTRGARAQSSKDILDYAFSTYKYYTILEEGTCIKKLPVKRGITEMVEVKTIETITLPLKEEEYKSLQKKIYMPDELDAPVIAGTDAGFIQFVLNGEVIVQSNLKICQDVRRKVFTDYLGDVIKEWCRIMRWKAQ
ncbi:MAG TPA: D-alanyl-D-alanine carboxypeptidase [Clostridiaceae bacterium]|nr:D-alanyl-D-alanine carboxypeptidase [Clostridiaceae bacterium]